MPHVAHFRPAEDRQLGEWGPPALIATFIDNGTPFDISDATTLQMLVLPPDGVLREETAVLSGDGTDGALEFTFEDGDIDQVGRWQFQGHAVGDEYNRYTEVKGFTVHANLVATAEPPTPDPDPPPEEGGVGGGAGPDEPTLPDGGIVISAGSTTATRQALIDGNAPGTVFILAAGVHTADGSNTPKTGNQFVGELGAEIDCAVWITADPTQAVFRAHNEDIDDVRIANLIIRNAPQYAVRSYVDNSSGWIVEDCEFDHCNFGIEVCHQSITRRNWIHHSTTAAYTGNTPHDVLFEYNLIEDTLAAPNQKLVEGYNHIWRYNTFRRMAGSAIWEDGDNYNVLVEFNLIEDCEAAGVFHEISGIATIRNNTIRRCGGHGILLSTSQNCTIEDNVVEDCFRGIWMQVNLDVVDTGGSPVGGWDLENNIARNNAITLTAAYASGAYTTGIDYSGSGDPTPYLTGGKNLSFQANAHTVPDAANYWFNGGAKSWAQWQALPQDVGGSVTIEP